MGPEREQAVPLAPLVVVPATALGVQGCRQADGTPAVMLQLSNAVVMANFPMDLEQARQHVSDVQRAILEAEAVVTPPAKLHLPGEG